MAISWLQFVLLLLISEAEAPSTSGPQRHELWQTGLSLVASIRVASLTSVFSPAVCLSKCLEEDCTLLTLTNVTDWQNKSQVYLEPCSILCNTFVAIRIPSFYFPLDSVNQLLDLGSLRLPGRQRTLRYGLGSQSGNPFTCTGPSGNPHVKYLLNNLDTNNYLITDLNEQWQPTQGLTLAVWVMFPGLAARAPMFEFYSNNQLINYASQFWFAHVPGQLFYNKNGFGGFPTPSVMSMTPGQWYHVAMTSRPGGELVFYWNATQIYRIINAGASMAGFQPSNLLVGASSQQKAMLRACLAHATVHSETMSQSQLQHLMMTQLALP